MKLGAKKFAAAAAFLAASSAASTAGAPSDAAGTHGARGDATVDVGDGPAPPRRPAPGGAPGGQGGGGHAKWLRPEESPTGPSPRAAKVANARASAGQQHRVGRKDSAQVAGQQAEDRAAANAVPQLPPLTPGGDFHTS